jgi:hypothetical protein
VSCYATVMVGTRTRSVQLIIVVAGCAFPAYNVLTRISWGFLPNSTLGPPEQSLNTIALRTGVLALATIGLIAVLGVVNVSLHPQ